MKKILTLLLVVAMLLGCTACFRKNTEPEETVIDATQEVTEAATEPATEGTDETEAAEEPTEEEKNGVDDNPFDDEETESDREETEPSAPETEKPTEPKEEEPKPTEGKTEPEQKPTEAPNENQGSGKPAYISYETYQNMSASEQMAYMNSFENIDDFYVWYNWAKAQYDAENPDIEVGDEGIDMGDIIEGNEDDGE